MNCSCGAFLRHYITKLVQIHLFAVPASQMLSLDDRCIALRYDNSCLDLIKRPLLCGHWEVSLDEPVESVLSEVQCQSNSRVSRTRYISEDALRVDSVTCQAVL